MEKRPVIRMWITKKNGRNITAKMNETMVAFLSTALDNGCNGSTFAEDSERVIVYTLWSNEMELEKFRSSDEYKSREKDLVDSFISAGFELENDILFNSTAKILFSN